MTMQMRDALGLEDSVILRHEDVEEVDFRSESAHACLTCLRIFGIASMEFVPALLSQEAGTIGEDRKGFRAKVTLERMWTGTRLLSTCSSRQSYFVQALACTTKYGPLPVIFENTPLWSTFHRANDPFQMVLRARCNVLD